jgi:hypothetical protein
MISNRRLSKRKIRRKLTGMDLTTLAVVPRQNDNRPCSFLISRSPEATQYLLVQSGLSETGELAGGPYAFGLPDNLEPLQRPGDHLRDHAGHEQRAHLNKLFLSPESAFWAESIAYRRVWLSTRSLPASIYSRNWIEAEPGCSLQIRPLLPLIKNSRLGLIDN